MRRRSGRISRWRGLGEIMAVEQDFAGIGLVDADDGAGQRRFAAAGFADQAHGLAGTNVEIDVIDGMNEARRVEEPVAWAARSA